MRVLVTSHWKMRDAWVPFQRLFDKHWPDCPWSVTLLTDLINEEWTKHAIVLGKDNGYSKNLLEALNRIDDSVVLLIMEDMFLSAKVETDFVSRAYEIMRMTNTACFRLYPCPGSDQEIAGNKDFGVITKEADYRVSCMAALWKTDALRRILPRTDTPWDFEITGTNFTRSFDEIFYSVRRDRNPWPFQHFATAITRGVWEQSALDYCRKEGINVTPLPR